MHPLSAAVVRPTVPDWLRALGILGLLAFAVLSGVVAGDFSPPEARIPASWPSVGLYVVALGWALPRWRLPLVPTILAVDWGTHLLTGRENAIALVLALGSTLAAVLVITVTTNFARRTHPSLCDFTDLLRFIASVGAASTIAGLMGAVAVQQYAGGDLHPLVRGLATSYGASILLLAPLGMHLVHRTRPWAGLGEATAQWFLLTVTVVLVYAPGQHLPLAFLPLPILAWGAARLHPREVTAQLILTGGLIWFLTLLGHGPFAYSVTTLGLPPEAFGTLLETNLAAAALVTLPLMLLMASHQNVLDEVRRSHDLVDGILAATTSTAILGTDLLGRIEFFNVGAERLTGHRAAQVARGAHLAHVRDEDDDDSYLQIRFGDQPAPGSLAVVVEPMAAGGEAVTSDWALVCADGGRRTISLTLTRRLDATGAHVGYLGVAEDVTERRRHEVRVATALEHEKALVERLAWMDATKNDFLATVSHELRTPITTIVGFSQLMLNDTSTPPTAMHRQIAHRIERNGRRLLGLVEDMLVMSHVEGGSFRVETAPLDVRRIVCSALEDITDSATSQGLRLHHEPPREPVSVHGDAEKLERALGNLLSNAVKFNVTGGRIEVTLETREKHVEIAVRDTGPGIGSTDLAHLFDRFYRGSAARELAVQGAGLGLTIARTIVEGHDGSLTCESRPGEGSTFRITLPRPGETSGAVGRAWA